MEEQKEMLVLQEFLPLQKELPQAHVFSLSLAGAYERPMLYEKDKADNTVDGNNHENEVTKEEIKKE